MVRICYALIAGLAGLLSFVSAHPGDTVKTEAAMRAEYLRNIPVQSRSLTHCTEEFRKRGIDDTNFARREAAVRQLRKQRGLDTGMNSPSILFRRKHTEWRPRCRLSQGP